MKTHRKIKIPCLLHSLKKKLLIHDWDSIISKSCCTCSRKTVHVHEFLASKALCDCGCLNYMYSGLCTFILYILESLKVIHRRLCIRHTYHHREASSCSCGGTCLDVFLVRKSRIAEVYMCVYQSRCNYKSICIDDLRTLCLQIVSCLNYVIAVDEHIHDLVCMGDRINDSSILYQ